MADNIYSVKQVNDYIKRMFESDYLLPRVSVRGEISNLKYHSSGHIYFSLKDADAVLKGVMFRSKAAGLKVRLSEGLKVVVTGQVSIYEATGSYQIYATKIEEEGKGDLFLRFEELKNRLSEMGLFDAAYKKPIPKFARTVGIVTAETGAALQDIINVATRRNPYVQLILSPALVQGDGAPESIVRAIERLDRIKPDLMIVGRGGGSIEDLWAFNDERVAKAVFECDTPIISAVGHEVDFTIIDFVSDLRAPTPSAAAELAVFDARAFEENIGVLENRLNVVMDRVMQGYRNALEKREAKLRSLHPGVVLEQKRRRLSLLKERLHTEMDRKFRNTKERLRVLEARLSASSPLEKLRGGYGALEKDGAPLLSAKDAVIGDELTIRLHDGTVEATVSDVS